MLGSEYVLSLGLYGRDALLPPVVSNQWMRWYEDIVRLANSFDVPLTHSSYELGEQEDISSDQKNCLLKRSDNRLRNILKEKQLCAVDIYSMLTKPNGYLSSDFDLNCSLAADESGRYNYLCIDLPQFKDKVGMSLLPFLLRHIGLFNEYVNAVYGFVVVMTRYDTGYPIGLSSTRSTDEVSYNCNVWSSVGRKECDQQLRNVHGLNFLSAQHLAIQIEGIPLQEWIESDPSRGHLETFNERLTLWSFMRNESDYEALHYDYPPLVKVRDALKEAGAFAWWPLPE